MNYDQFGRAYTDTTELVEMLYHDPKLDLSRFFVIDPDEYNKHVRRMFLDYEKLKAYEPLDSNLTLEQFDQATQEQWLMPLEYAEMDIANWLMDQCKTEAELQRIGHELLLYQARNAFNLLRYMKYMVDIFRKNNIVWGLGRGSSVASYALYLIGVHKIDSMYYDLDISEFLR